MKAGRKGEFFGDKCVKCGGSETRSTFLGLPEIQIRLRVFPFSHKDVKRTEIVLAKYNFNTKL
jgi:hypothetical protein